MNYISNVNINTIADELRTHYNNTGEKLTITQWSKEFHHSAKSARKIGTWEEIEKEAYFNSSVGRTSNNVLPELTKLQESEIDTNDWMDLIEKYQHLDKKANPKQTHVVAGNPSSTKPIAIIATSDWHLGGSHVDYKKWKEDMLYVMGLPKDQFRMLLLGDLIDNIFPRFRSAQALFANIMTPKNQKAFLKDILQYLSPYLDVACWGNHDCEFDEKNVGYSDVENIIRSFCHYFYGKGFVTYRVGKQKYDILMTHHLKGYSIHHNMHGNIRAWDETHSEIIIGAHKHSPGFLKDVPGTSPETGEPLKRYLIQLGTYKTGDDTYSQRYFKKGVIENPTLVLYPDEHRVVYFENVQDAVQFLGIKPKKLYKFPKLG